jgi:hypothetical protein
MRWPGEAARSNLFILAFAARSEGWYRLQGSNQGPPDPQSGALTN